jgi:hypothetical protein
MTSFESMDHVRASLDDVLITAELARRPSPEKQSSIPTWARGLSEVLHTAVGFDCFVQVLDLEPSIRLYRRSISVCRVQNDGRFAGEPRIRTMLQSSASTQI